MDNFTIKINPQYVKQTDELEMIDGKERRLHEVQKRMKLDFEQLPEFTIITAPTGTGKSYAFPFPVLKSKKAPKGIDDVEQVRGLIVLPTNALISELTESFRKTYKEQGVIVNQLTGPELNKHEVKGHNRWKKAIEIAEESDILITNPDLINFAMHGGYHQYHWNNKTATTRFSSFLDKFNYIIFDEYHLYDEAQIANILTLVKLREFFLQNEKPKKGSVHGVRFLFVSATPEVGLKNIFEEEGYEHTEIIEQIVNEKNNARAIHGELEVEFFDSKDIKGLIRSKIPELQEVLKTKKALLILNNVRTIQELASELEPHFKDYEIYQSTGYVSKSENHTEKVEAANLIIATNKAEVGVNYDVEYCIMETGRFFQNFVQRFGRVSRGDLTGKVVVAVEKYSKYKRILKNKTQCDYYDFVELMRLQMQQRTFYTKKVPMYIGEYLWCIENSIRRFQDYSVWQYLSRKTSEEKRFYYRYIIMDKIDNKIREMIKHHLRISGTLTKNERTLRKKIYPRLEKQAPRTFEWVTWWNNYLDTYLTFRDSSKVVKIFDTVKNEELEYSLDWILQHKEVIKIEVIEKEKYEIIKYTVGNLKERSKDIQYVVSTLPNAGMSGNNILDFGNMYELDKIFKKSVGRIYDKARKGIEKKDDLQVELCKLILELHQTFDRKRLKIESIDNEDVFW
ncbi:MAG: type I-D CRISPR-associated helicase Cas3' [Saprospiraceae bacterium]